MYKTYDILKHNNYYSQQTLPLPIQLLSYLVVISTGITAEWLKIIHPDIYLKISISTCIISTHTINCNQNYIRRIFQIHQKNFS